jgi:hypothetical protein
MSILYYCTNTSTECAAILRDGFSDEHEAEINPPGIFGVYLSDCPGEQDSEYPDDQLLEIVLSPQISIAQFEIFVPKEGTRWREFVVPAHLLNEWAEIRLLPKEEWGPKWERWLLEQKLKALDRGFKLLIERGYLEVARDAAGKPIYRQGQLAYKLSAKAAKMDEQALRDLIEGRE